MIGIFIAHALILFLALAISMRIVPESIVSGAIGYLHNAIGITTPTAGQVRMVALIWIGALLFIADGILLLFVFLVSHTHAG